MTRRVVVPAAICALLAASLAAPTFAAQRMVLFEEITNYG